MLSLSENNSFYECSAVYNTTLTIKIAKQLNFRWKLIFDNSHEQDKLQNNCISGSR